MEKILEKILEQIGSLIKDARSIVEEAYGDLNLGRGRIERWGQRAMRILEKYISVEEAKKFHNTCGASNVMDPNGNFRRHAEAKITFLTSLQEDIKQNPDFWKKHLSEIESMIEQGKEDSLSLVKDTCSRFHLVAKQLRSRYENRPTLDVEDEYDVQDLLHALLKLFFDDVRPEEWTPSYAGKSARMDFLLKDEKLVIEVKKTRRGLGSKEIGDQLIVDIGRYKTHPDCKTLFCFVYDPEGHISNPQGIERDLSRQEEELIVEIFIVPKGY